jgi:hypothetical protein
MRNREGKIDMRIFQKNLQTIILTTLIAALVLLAFGPMIAADNVSAPDPATAPAIIVDESNIQVRLLDRGVRVSIPIEWQSQLLEWARIETDIVDLRGKSLTGKSANVFGFRRNQMYRTMLPPVQGIENVSLYCLRYKITLSDGSMIEGKKSLAESVGALETHLIGSNEFLAGSSPTLRLIALNHATGKPVPDAIVSFSIVRSTSDGTADNNKDSILFSGRTDGKGTVDAVLRIPEGRVGPHTLIVSVNSQIGDDLIEKPVTIRRVHKILLTTDKPLYQPGQTIHIRALSLSAAALKPAGDTDIVIEVQDAKGNKVFKRATRTDRFGIAAADFVLADEVNAGSYKIRIILGETTVEKDVTVKRYVLPKFKISLSSDRDYYMPGETLRGEVQVDYFFGKPVTGGIVLIKLSKFDVNFSEFARIEGKTDSSGHYSFEVKLPSYFVGQPLGQGKAFVKVDARIVDGADHKEEVTRNISVAADPLTIVAIPESGNLVPGVENVIYIMTTYPDGRPARTRVNISVDPSGTEFRNLRTDSLGITSIALTPQGGSVDLKINARLENGASAKKTIALETTRSEHNILLRTDQALYKVGDTIDATVFATTPSGTIYIDLIKNGQTMLTRAIELERGSARLQIELSPNLSGSVQLSAYRITPSSDIIRDSRLLYVNPANDLKIDVRLDRETYRPGQDANIHFTVSDGRGHPVLAALGLSIVDESVFALQEMQPGLEKVYFTLEKELMKPRYEIHGYTLDRMILPQPERDLIEDISRRREAARVLLASVESFWEPSLRVNTFDDKRQAFAAELEAIMREKIAKIEKGLKRFHKRHDRFLKSTETLVALTGERLMKVEDATDPWGNLYVVEDTYFIWNDHLVFKMTSIGPDETAGTADDVVVEHRPEIKERRWRNAMFDMVEEGIARPMMALAKSVLGENERSDSRTAGASGDKKQVRVRKYFPETLLFNPALLTDQYGRATLSLKMADSITTWRMASMASSLGGAMGSVSTPIRVFQDFFIDIDLPVALTQNDRISIPIAVYNYLPGAQNIRLEMTEDDWFELMDDPVKEIRLEKDEVSVVYFTITAKKVGRHELTVHGLGSKMSDAIKRQILVAPDGKEFLVNFNDRLDGAVEKIIDIPRNAIDDASAIFVKIYPGMFSQIVEGLDSILRMPSGCFEQTSSTTYPNILVLDYMKQTGLVSPEIQMKAEGFINTGYQRLLSFEVDGGGFEWFGNPPANQILTAYGLMEFKDMAEVHEVDPNVISRTQRWLLSKQQADGSWAPDASFLHQESWGRIQNSNLPVTAYVAWALLDTGYKGAETAKAVRYIKTHLDEANDPYVLALCANALVLADRNDGSALRMLDNMKIEKDGAIHWESKLNTMTYSHGDSAHIETTALAAIAFLRSGRYPGLCDKIMTYLIRSKDAHGTWHSTQATVLALKAMLTALGSSTEEVDGRIEIRVNGEYASTVTITSADSDVMRLIDLKQFVRKGANNVSLSFRGEGSMLYQIVGRYYLPWAGDAPGRRELMSIDVKYDKTHIQKDDVVGVEVRVRNNRPAAANMVMVDLGIPPGFSVMPEGLQALVEKGAIEKYTLTGRQIIIYVRQIGANSTLKLSYEVKAKFPVKAKTPTSRVYEYYDPSVEDFAEPVLLEITN